MHIFGQFMSKIHIDRHPYGFSISVDWSIWIIYFFCDCKDGSEWYFEMLYISDSGLIDFYKDLYNHYKDQGYIGDEDNIPLDNIYKKDLLEDDTSILNDDSNSDSNYDN